MRKILFLLAAVLLALTAQARDRQSFDKNWRFTLGDSIIMSKTDFDDGRWRLLDVPHDWAIEGDFYVSNPSGAGGGALPGGIGWYRKQTPLSMLMGAKWGIGLMAIRVLSTTSRHL